MSLDPGAMPTPDTMIPNWVPTAISVVALCVSVLGIVIAFRKYRADQSTPWVQTLLRYAEEELQALANETKLVSQFYSAPFKNLTKKREIAASINHIRDESLQRLDSLAALTASGSSLRFARAELSAISDSYFDNSELSVDSHTANHLKERYQAACREYVKTIRHFAREVCERKGLFPAD